MLLNFYSLIAEDVSFGFSKELTYSNGCRYEVEIYYSLKTNFCLFYSEFEIYNYDKRKNSRILHLKLPFSGCYDLYGGGSIDRIYVLF